MKEKSWEYEGRTVEEATQIALEELGLERDDIHIEVLEEPQKGFLGLGGKEARIRVELVGEWEVLGKTEEEPASVVGLDKEKESLQRPESDAIVLHKGKPAEMTKDILAILEIEAMVEAGEKEDSVIVDVWGEDVAILIGRAGNTLDALQYLVNVSCRRTGEITKKIIIDVEGYRKRRKAKLEKQVEQLAEKAISQNRTVELDPMNASERKIVHITLRKIDGVWTESIGEGSERHVVIHSSDENARRST
jgi:spoIIIJ-associated protein